MNQYTEFKQHWSGYLNKIPASINLVALLKHQLELQEILQLPSKLASAWKYFEEIWPRATIVDRNDQEGLAQQLWRCRQQGNHQELTAYFEKEGLLEFCGPCGFTVVVFKHTFAVRHEHTAWLDFLNDDTTRFIYRETFRLFAALLDTDQLFYVPDNVLAPSICIQLAKEGHTFKLIDKWLEINCGPAWRTFSQDPDLPRSAYFKEPF